MITTAAHMVSFLKLEIVMKVVQNALQDGKKGHEKVWILLKLPLQFIGSCGKIHSVTFSDYMRNEEKISTELLV